MKKFYFLFVFILLSYIAFAQSYHTINIDGNNDFNTTTERLSTTSGTDLYSYITWDKDYLYVGLSGNSPAGTITDADRVYHIYIDTDPQQNPANGTGTTAGVPWRWNPILPFSANYHYAFKTVDNTEYKDVYTAGSWQSSSFSTGNWKGSGYWESRISLADIGNPQQINVVVYSEEDWDNGFICGGAPSNLFTNSVGPNGSNSITFNNHWLNHYLIDQISPNNSYYSDNYQWLIRLKASTLALSDTTAWAGMSINATNGFDTGIDLPKPPAPPSNYIQIYFPHASWASALGPNYTRDIKNLVSLDSTTSSWGFDVSTDLTNTNVTISADNFSFIPSNYNIQLYDVSGNITHDLRVSNYTYNSGTLESVKNFNLIIGVSLASQEIDVTPTSLDFGSIKVNRDTTLNLTISNLGDSTLVVSNIVSSSSVFTFTGGTTYNIAANSSVIVPVKFKPTSVQTYNATLTIYSNDTDEGTVVIPLTGTGLNLFPNISASLTSLNFGAVKVDYDSSRTFKIYNTGDTTLNVSNIFSSDAAFILSSSSSFSVLKNDSASITVKFSPSAVTAYSAILNVLSNDPDTDTLSITLSGSGITSTISNTIAAGWNLMSIPVTAENNSAAAIIGDDIASFFLYGYSNTGGYLVANNLYPGSSYWLGVESAFTLDVTGTPVSSNDSVSLNSGWNLIAAPYVRSYLTNHIYFKRGSTTMNGSNAVTNGWIQNNYYGYNRSTGSYYSEDTLKQWNGYWFAALTDSVKMIFYHDSTSGSPLKKNDLKEDIESTPEHWLASIKTEINGVIDPLLYFGADVDATDGFDAAFDIAKPPVSPAANSIQSYFEKTDWANGFNRYISDVKSSFNLPEPGKSWTFKFISKSEGTLSLSWNDIIQQVPEVTRNNYSFKLTGQGISGFINMLTQFNHVTNIQANTYYTFTINSTVTNVEDNNSQVYTFKLDQNYPNPFNPSTNINFQIDKPSEVKIVVYNSLGEKVRTLLNEFKSAGTYHVTFNASNLPSGVYFCRLTSGEKISIQKMTLLK